jgi:GNAT superfamily N-acetyltransferase
MIEIRVARATDAEAASEVLRRSIRELCADDHRGDAATLAAWLFNKTPDNLRRWIASAHVVVADGGGALCGVAAIQPTGEISLNYVAPEARFRGISKALVAALEAWAVERGLARCTLRSTATARRFYASAGYRDTGPPTPGYGITIGYPMAKQLPSG